MSSFFVRLRNIKLPDFMVGWSFKLPLTGWPAPTEPEDDPGPPPG